VIRLLAEPALTVDDKKSDAHSGIRFFYAAKDHAIGLH
jgi:hypothetical protein